MATPASNPASPEQSNGRKRASKPKASGRIETWPPKQPPAAKPEADDLISAAEAAVMQLLHSDIEAKDMNAAIANAVRLIQVKNRIKPDTETVDFWDEEE